jgi:hypothetical protein
LQYINGTLLPNTKALHKNSIKSNIQIQIYLLFFDCYPDIIRKSDNLRKTPKKRAAELKTGKGQAAGSIWQRPSNY